MKNKTKSVLAARRNRYGYVFIVPWIIGFLLFFLLPLGQSIYYSFCKVSPSDAGFSFDFIRLENYRYLFEQDTTYKQNLWESVKSFLYSLPLTVILSLVLAVILNQKFRGRLFARAIFFIPVIVTSGVVISIIQGDAATSLFNMSEKSSVMMRSFEITDLLRRLDMPEELLNLLTDFVNTVFNLTWKSGVQILILLAALQTVPGSLYEAGHIDGASEWESFWFITFPLITPSLLLTTVYSIVDELSSYSNQYQAKIIEYATEYMNYSYSSALAAVYFVCVMALIGLVFLFARRRVFYMVD